MGWFSADIVEGIGNGVNKASEGIRYLLTGDISPEARIELEKLLLEAEKLEAKMLEGQVKINVEEAKSGSLYKGGWRPAVGWIGVVGIGYHYVGYPVLLWYLALSNSTIIPPVLDSDGLMALVSAMLGIGGYRTYEKFKGITK